MAIDPDPAAAGELLTCSWSFSDPDGDSDLSSVVWLLEGVAVASGPTCVATGSAGDVVTCQVTADDGEDTGGTAEASITLASDWGGHVTEVFVPTNSTGQWCSGDAPVNWAYFGETTFSECQTMANITGSAAAATPRRGTVQGVIASQVRSGAREHAG